MTEKKSSEVDAWLAKPPRQAAIVLVFGSDRGLVSERARRFAQATGLALDDAFCVVRLDAATIEAEPGRLEDEAATVSMFASDRLIWIRNAGAGKALADAVKRLAAAPPTGTTILIEAGELKKTGLRAAVAEARNAVALPCYADDAGAIDRLIEGSLAESGQRITLEARHRLREALGGDRLASRNEIAKLLLYTAGDAEIGIEAVEAAVGDAASISADAAIDAAIAGRTVEADRLITRVLSQGSQAYALLSAAMRQFQSLALMRRGIDVEGRTIQTAMAGARPPVFFTRLKDVEIALRRWDSAAISAALSRLQAAILDTRKTDELAQSITRQILLSISRESERRAARR